MSDESQLAKALTAFHTELPKVGKGSTNPAFKSKYADLADIVSVVLPALAKQGLAWITTPRVSDDGFVLEYELRHTSGDSITGSWPLPDPEKATPQQMGSAVTYAKRYTLSAVTGIAPDEDDDGNAASKGPGAAPRQTRAARVQDSADRIEDAVVAIGKATTPELLDKIETHARSLGIHGIDRVRTALEAKRAELGPSLVDHWAAAEPPKES
ncbi:ERF family protein [Microbacterium sp. ProA8]|uniref:ERF family protein n=1 Tax=Microbacterium chionoecetis TaxID=3153754 RepID=UPI003264F988